MREIRFEPRAELRPKPQDEGKLGFGKQFTDYMLAIDYAGEKGWHDARIIPYGPISFDPAMTSLHYGQLVFEGLKAYKDAAGRVVMFRPHENIKRLNRSNERLCMPSMDVEETVEMIAELVRREREWIPTGEGTSLYIRPFIMATDTFLGVHPSDSYLFLTILSPVGSYYKGGLQPIRIYVEDEYVRAVRGGTGFTKCAGNYAASLKSQHTANELGYSQVLWLDGIERRYLEEVGTTNVMVVIDGEVLTPELNGSILPGITRDSSIQLLRSMGYTVTERKIGIDEVFDAAKQGKLNEAFATGTAAVVSPIGELKWKDETIFINEGKIGKVCQTLYDELTSIQRGRKDDPFGWVYRVD